MHAAKMNWKRNCGEFFRVGKKLKRDCETFIAGLILRPPFS
jgi:hypothetical protein